MQAAAAATRRRWLRQGFGLVVYRRGAAPQTAADSAKTQASVDHGEAATRLPRRAGGARRIPNRTADPDRRAVARLAANVGRSRSRAWSSLNRSTPTASVTRESRL